MPEIRTEITAGPVWLPRSPVHHWRLADTHGDGWSIVIEQWRIAGRLGWQRVTETITMPGSRPVPQEDGEQSSQRKPG